jgi:ABC-2 type transport system ATP-binding protein
VNLDVSALPLDVRGLVRRYGKFTAVDHLDLTVRPGEIVGFLGPNGAGKTTTLRVCSGLLRPDSGDILVAGASLGREPLLAKGRLGFAPDRPFLYDRLTGREFLDFVGALYRVPESVVQERGGRLLGRLDLGDAADALAETYSLGMRQKVSIAAALLHEPPLVLLDEPLGGLDPGSARALKDLLREHAARGNGVLVSTHLLDVAERLCDRVVILHHGRRLAEGTLANLRTAGSSETLEDVFLTLTRESP